MFHPTVTSQKGANDEETSGGIGVGSNAKRVYWLRNVQHGDTNRTTTIGRELVDLQDAKARGAISEEEYTKAKKDILEGGPLKAEQLCSEAK